MKLGYVCVSERKVSRVQRRALHVAGCERIFEDRVGGPAVALPQLARALKIVSRGDEFIVCDLGQLGRSVAEAITIAFYLDRRSIPLRSLYESFDSEAPLGRADLSFLKARAQDERAQTRALIDVAERRRGKVGRPAKLSDVQVALARRMLAEGQHTRAEIAEEFGVTLVTLAKALKRPVRGEGGPA